MTQGEGGRGLWSARGPFTNTKDDDDDNEDGSGTEVDGAADEDEDGDGDRDRRGCTFVQKQRKRQFV